MTSKRAPERATVTDGASVTAVLDKHVDERAKWDVHLHVDKFDIGQVILAAEWHGLRHREPTGPELLEWAAATGNAPGDTSDVDGNLLTRLGLARLGNLFIGATGAASQALNSTHARIGLGDTNTAAATTDTDLGAASGSTHRQFKLADSCAQGTGANSGVTTIIATFGTGVANFAVAEWCIDGGAADGTTVTSETASTPGMCNHKIASLGTKTSSQVWVVTATITIA